MTLTVIILIACTLMGGLSINLIPGMKQNLRLPLIFAGSYLFAITIIHIIPELFSISRNPSTIGLYVLIGFFMQQFLEYFSSGVEHGHVHTNKAVSVSGRFSIIIALMIHSLLEGTLLTHDSPFHEKHESYSLLLGIVLHKMPAAFALMATMQGLGKRAIYLLILFSLASPLGMILGDFVLLSEDAVLVVFAIVCGSFLHISTTIFVEASPEHHFGLNKILISLLGAVLAILVEFMV
ncbi:ZIP Zinc transporter [Ekhidna lutea]|uniref:ZIP Zinc transporter n=1 Tax=Ekhidna lutea TaxID=447679 RepID=A0A239IXY9_EKHLU|nr:ZIP family metal transporter [Ekhidna lutea]SNS98497.1 ZIP Zinc transporter [Ekhidna lutea]